jgi:cation-transporting P-type ATPase 13A2
MGIRMKMVGILLNFIENSSHENQSELSEVEKVPWDDGKIHEIKQFEIAISGKAFQLMVEAMDNPFEDEYTKAVYRETILQAKIYARMSPDHKAQLVEQLQNNLEDMIGMWGDGANDCKALKTADVGLSLSEAEASIAAPFTSKIQNISPIIKLLREGRTSLVTCFQMFKFMALYSMIQFCTVIMLYNIGSNLGNWQFLYIDLFLVIPLSITMSRTGSYKQLDRSRPTGHLISFSVLFSVISQITIQSLFQIFIYFNMESQKWFKYLKPKDDLNIESMENTVLFLYSWPQYIFVVMAFSVGKPFRKPMYTNYLLMLSIIVFGAITYMMILVPSAKISKVMQLVSIPTSFKVRIVLLSIVNLAIWYGVEKLFLWNERKNAVKK